ncbi:cupin domain-containing protein [Sphingosinicella ginsenosidimutans]|nr:cupin domain-containing protein [Sphingosinicella ginsenosidimutans]
MSVPQRPQIGSLPLRFGYSPADQAVWRKGDGSGLEYRSLGLADASQGLLDAQLVRAAKAGVRQGWYDPSDEFHYLQVLAGSLTLRTWDGERLTLTVGDAVVQPPFTLNPDVYEYSDDYEALEFASKGSFEHIDRFREKHGLTRTSEAPKEAVITHDTPETYITGDGPRSFFTYRDLGATAASNRRMHIHVVGIADQPPGGTGWHTHSMDQFFMPITGWLDIWVEGLGKVRMKRGDAMFIPAGIRHNVTEFTRDYTVVEACIPTDYDTLDATDPAQD